MAIGKKLYQSHTMPSIKWMAALISLTLLGNLYFQTYNDPNFIKTGQVGFSAVLSHHVKYPNGFFLFIGTVFFPSLYYGFIRGVRFHEEALIINRGLPFFNMVINYDQIGQYELINQKNFMAITLKDGDDEYLFNVNKMDRAMAILDQHHIPGKLGEDERITKDAHKKLVLFFLIVGVVIALIQYSGFVR